MKLFIKNMVSLRYKMAVRAELEKPGIQPEIVELGGSRDKRENVRHAA